MFTLFPTTKYRRDVRRLHKRGYNMGKLTTALHILTNKGELPKKYRPHPLRGNFSGYIDAHIEPDWILIFEVKDDQRIALHRTGTHADLF